MGQAEDQARAAVELAPDDPHAALPYASLLMRRSDDPRLLDLAGRHLSRADRNRNGLSRDEAHDLKVNLGILLALTGRVGEGKKGALRTPA